MKKAITIASIAVLAWFVLSHSQVINALLYFLLTGAIPGTKFALPYWTMMAFYCAIIALIMTDFIDSLFRARKESRSAKTRTARLPRRRYSNAATPHSA